MLNRKIIILVTAILLMSQSGSIYAESLNLDLETAKIIALENNPTIKIAREGVKKSRAMVTEARANLMPVIRGFSSFQHAWELPTMVFNIGGVQQKFKMGTENNIVYGINVSQPLFTGGAIWNGFQMSRIGRNIAEAQLKSIEQKLLSDVTRAYYGVLFANSALDVALEALESSKKNLEQVNKFFNAGKSSRFDVLRAEVQVANFKPVVVSSKNGLRLAESNL
ncbi:MAG: TolC family protein, partial [Candidatus Marinimicrobia bacterium]|nr:TolC family protein [Candidatus Neomarinimicrobiota bacterium]